MPIARTFDGHGVRATCPLQLGIDPTTSASRSQDFNVVNSIATAASYLVLPRQITRPTVRKQPIIWNIKRLKPFRSMIFRFKGCVRLKFQVKLLLCAPPGLTYKNSPFCPQRAFIRYVLYV